MLDMALNAKLITSKPFAISNNAAPPAAKDTGFINDNPVAAAVNPAKARPKDITAPTNASGLIDAITFSDADNISKPVAIVIKPFVLNFEPNLSIAKDATVKPAKRTNNASTEDFNLLVSIVDITFRAPASNNTAPAILTKTMAF